MALSQRVPERTRELRLPSIDQRRVLGASIVQRAASLMLVVFVCALVLAAVVASTVSIRMTVDGSGVLEPVRVVPIRPAQDGLVRRVMVATGDTIRAGQPVMILDSLDLEANVAALEGQRTEQLATRQSLLAATPIDQERAAAQRDQADAHVVRALAALRQQMVAYHLGSNVDSLVRSYVPRSHVAGDQLMSDIREAQAERAAAEAELHRVGNADLTVAVQDAKLAELQTSIELARRRMQRLVVRAPEDGVVLTDQIERLRGAYVRSGDQLLEIGNPTAWRAVVLVREADVHEIHVGDSASIDVPALEELRLPRLSGRVVEVGATPGSLADAPSIAGASPGASPGGSAAGGYRVTIGLDPDPIRLIGTARLRRGYSVTGKVVTRRGVILRILFDRARAGLRHGAADVP